MKNWSELYSDGTAITQLPSSIKYATGLVVLDLKNFRKLESSKQYLQAEIHGKPLYLAAQSLRNSEKSRGIWKV